MASTDDTRRAAIRERKRQAHRALQERHRRQEAAQTAAFGALDRLARELNRAQAQLVGEDADLLERAAAMSALAAQLEAAAAEVRTTASELVDVTGLTQSDVADLLGTRSALLFPRIRSTSRPPAPAVEPPVGVVA